MMEERLDYIIDVMADKENNLYSADGFNEEGYWYVSGRLSDGKMLSNVLWPMKYFTFIENGDKSLITISEAKRRGYGLEVIAEELLRCLNSAEVFIKPVDISIKEAA